VFPDRLPRATDGSAEPIVDGEPKAPSERGRRAIHGPGEDRAHRLGEDRST